MGIIRIQFDTKGGGVGLLYTSLKPPNNARKRPTWGIYGVNIGSIDPVIRSVDIDRVSAYLGRTLEIVHSESYLGRNLECGRPD